MPLTAIAALSFAANAALPLASLIATALAPSTERAQDLWLGGGFDLDSAAAGAGDLFDMDAEWQTVAKHTGTIQLSPRAILNAKDEDLKRAFDNMERRHIGLAVWLNLLEWPEKCGKIYAEADQAERVLARLHSLNAKVKYVALGSQYFYGHFYPATAECRLSIPDMAEQMVKKIPRIRAYFPDAEIGLAEYAFATAGFTDELIIWADAFRHSTGITPAFFHFEPANFRQAAGNIRRLANAMKSRKIPFGIVYDEYVLQAQLEARLSATRENIAAVEAAAGIHPDTAIFRSWHSRLLPEKQSGTFTNLVYEYLQAPPSLALMRQSNMVTGQVVDAAGRPMVSANLTFEAFDSRGKAKSMWYQHLEARIPHGAATALVGLRINQYGACICAGWSSVSIGTINYREEGTGVAEKFAPYPYAAGKVVPSVRRIELVPNESSGSDFKRFPVTAGATYSLDVPLSVPANGERAGFIAVWFYDEKGKLIRMDRLWFRPSLQSLGGVVTDNEGRFRTEIPPQVAAVEPEIRAYFAGSASVGFQSAVLSQ